MKLTVVEEGLPEELKEHLMDKEKVHYFSYITYKGGCLRSSSREDYWIALTNKRVIYKAKVSEIEHNITKVVEKDGIIPLDKISFVEVTDVSEKQGCSSAQAYELRISSSGGTVRIPIPTKEKGLEIRKIYSEIIEPKSHKEHHEHHKTKEKKHKHSE